MELTTEHTALSFTLETVNLGCKQDPNKTVDKHSSEVSKTDNVHSSLL